MSFRRAWAIVAASLFLLPLVPAGAAEDASCESEACRSIALFVQGAQGSSGALSSLPGDGMPGTVTTASFVQSRTLPLTRAIELARNGTFRVVLEANKSWPHANVSYEVQAVDLAGRSITLGSLRVDASRPAVDAGPIANTTLNTTARSLDPLLGLLPSEVDPGLEGNLARNSVNASTDAMCALPAALAQTNGLERAPCQNLNGDVGRAGTLLNPRCSSAKGPRTGFEGTFQDWWAWWAIKTFDEHRTAENENGPRLGSISLSPPENVPVPLPTEERICRSRHDDLNATADAAGPQGPGGPLIERPTLDAPPASPMPDLSPRSDWKDVRFNIRADTGFPMRGDFVRIPSGYRLVLRVNTTISLDASSGPVEIEFGRADALTRLEIRTPTDAFLEFAYGREAIGPGRHTGVFANLTDTDLFSYQVRFGERVRVVPKFAVAFDAWTPAGEFRRIVQGLDELDTVGDWTLSARRASTTAGSPPSEYEFEIVHVPSADAFESLSPGNHSRTLDGENEVDHFSFFAWRGQPFSFEVLPSPGVGVELNWVSGLLRQESWNSTSVTARPWFNGTIQFSVHRMWGEGSYVIRFVRDEAWNLSQATVIAAQWPNVSGGLTPYAGGVDHTMVDRETFQPSIVHTGPDGSTAIVVANASNSRIPRDDQGRVYGFEDPGGFSSSPLAQFNGNAADLLARGVYPAFGSDGALYFWGRSIDKTTLFRMMPDRSIEASPYTLPFNVGPSQLLFAPDGRLFLAGSGSLVDFSAGTITPAAEYAGLRTFGDSGFYRILMSNMIEHVGADGRSTLVGWTGTDSIRIDDLAASGDRLYASLYDSSTGRSKGTGFLEALGPGFDGFHPPFDVSPPGDLVIARVEEEVELGLTGLTPAETHRFRVTFQNLGSSITGRFLAAGFGGSGAFPTKFVPIEELTPNSETSATFEWIVRPTSPGDHQIIFVADWSDEVVELDDSNNHASVMTHVLIGGNQGACEGASPVAAVRNACGMET